MNRCKAYGPNKDYAMRIKLERGTVVTAVPFVNASMRGKLGYGL